jgi:hypothetical protein
MDWQRDADTAPSWTNAELADAIREWEMDILDTIDELRYDCGVPAGLHHQTCVLREAAERLRNP